MNFQHYDILAKIVANSVDISVDRHYNGHCLGFKRTIQKSLFDLVFVQVRLAQETKSRMNEVNEARNE